MSTKRKTEKALAPAETTVKNGWYAVSLEGTLSIDSEIRPDAIGEPNVDTVSMVKKMLGEGKDVRILTWCAGRNPYFSANRSIQFVIQWCQQNIGHKLPVTNSIDINTVGIIDNTRTGGKNED